MGSFLAINLLAAFLSSVKPASLKRQYCQLENFSALA